MLFAAIERGGPARTAVVPSASAEALDPLMFRWFDRNAILCTDELATYDWFGSKMRRHHKVRYFAREYARMGGGTRIHVNTAEGFFGLFKRGIFGIHHNVSAKHPVNMAVSDCANYLSEGYCYGSHCLGRHEVNQRRWADGQAAGKARDGVLKGPPNGGPKSAICQDEAVFAQA